MTIIYLCCWFVYGPIINVSRRPVITCYVTFIIAVLCSLRCEVSASNPCSTSPNYLSEMSNARYRVARGVLKAKKGGI